MTTETKAPACPNCGATTGIFTKADLRWRFASARWEVCTPEAWQALDCTSCDHEWQRTAENFPDSFAGLGYASDAIQAEAPAMLAALRSVAAVLDMSDPGSENFADSAADCLDALLSDCAEVPAILARIDSGAAAPTAEAAPPTLGAHPALGVVLDDIVSFLAGFEDCEDNGEAVQSLMARIALVRGEG